MATAVTLPLVSATSRTDFISEINNGEIMAQNEYVERELMEIVFSDCTGGLGIKIIGGLGEADEKDYGIFIRSLLPGGLAQIDGRLQEGDMIIAVNGNDTQKVTNNQAVAVLRQASASNFIQFSIIRDQLSQSEYLEVLDVYGYATPASGPASRTTTPGVHHGGVLTSPWSGSRSPGIGSPIQRQGQKVSGSPVPHAQGNMASPYAEINSSTTFKHIQAPGQRISSPVATSSLISSPPPVLHVPSPINRLSPNSQPTTVPSAPQHFNRKSPKRVSLDQHVKLKVEKLEIALSYLGLEPSADQQAELRNRLTIDSQGTTTFGEFVKVCKELFKLQLEGRNITPGSLYFAANDVREMTQPPTFTPQMAQIGDMPLEEELAQVRQDRDVLQEEVLKLRCLLREKEYACSMAEEELLRIRREAQGAIHETRSLRSKIHLAEQAQRAARNMEHDYEEVVQLLEREIRQLKAGKPAVTEQSVSQKRLAILSTQLHRSDITKKTYEVATDKLLKFAETVRDVSSVSGAQVSDPGSDNGAKTEGNQGNKGSTSELSSQATDVIKTVKAIISSEPLPYGWDEAQTPDGMKYYINHLTNMTTWMHPGSAESSDQAIPNTVLPPSAEKPH